MEIAALLVALTIAVLAVTAVAERWQVPAPLLLIALGIVVSFVPVMPEVRLAPEVVLIGLLPPLLYAAALDTSLIDVATHRRPILLLSVGLVVFTTLGVGLVVHSLLDVGWATALALGAVVAPPDAVAATSIAKRIGLPRSVVTILEGESLLNDATALVSLRTAIVATATTVSIAEIGWQFVVAAGGGVLVGLLLFTVIAWVRQRIRDTRVDNALSLITPFTAYLLAEQITASGVIAVVVCGLLLGHQAPVLQTASSRLAERTNWAMVTFLLENAVFLLIGLQARWILEGVATSTVPGWRVVSVCLASLVAVVVLRMVWLVSTRGLLGLRTAGRARGAARRGEQAPMGRSPALGWRSSVVVGWAGMRGVVTLAAAFVIPSSVEHREVLLLVAFTVVAGTLFGQGLTLPWLAQRLRVRSPDPADDALALATVLDRAGRAGIAAAAEEAGEQDAASLDIVRHRIEHRTFAAWERLGDPDAGQETPTETFSRLRLAALRAERAEVLAIRSAGEVPQAVVSEALGLLDMEETAVVRLVTDVRRVGGRPVDGGGTGWCEDLEQARDAPVPEPLTPGRCGDCPEDEHWVHLRMCLSCGYVGCCDSSPHRHSTGHSLSSGHRVMQSAEPGESWRWCHVHQQAG